MASVRDIMRTDVVTIQVDDSARSLARVLSDSEISGVPVLDANGKVVGVASTTDLVRLAAGEAEVSLASATVRPEYDRSPDVDDDELDDVLDVDPYGFFLPEDSAFAAGAIFEQLPESTFDRVTVEDVMTPVSFSVTPDMTIRELCSYLVRGRIHRALVVEDGALLGIVTSQDVLRVVADGSLVV